jgi:hypothetical protein
MIIYETSYDLGRYAAATSNESQPTSIGYICLFNDSKTTYGTLKLQIKYLKEEKGCLKVFLEKGIRGDRESRPKFGALLDRMRPNNTLFFLKPDIDELAVIRFKEAEKTNEIT